MGVLERHAAEAGWRAVSDPGLSVMSSLPQASRLGEVGSSDQMALF